MSLFVDIEKRLGDFRLRAKFETDGNVLALLGASGAGKSVCLRCVAGLLRPDRGRIVLNGRTLFDSERRVDLPPQKRRVGYLFQSGALFPDMSVRKNIEAGLFRLSRAERREEALRLLRMVRLEELADRSVGGLSGGERQRVALARALGARPEALLLDEPFSALDDHLKWQLELSVLDLLRDYPGEVVLVSHSREEVAHLAQTVCVLNAGSSEPVVSARDLLEKPATISAARLSGIRNLSPLLPDRPGFVRAVSWDWVLPEAGLEEAGWLGIRAEDLRLADGENALSCTVCRRIRDDGADVLLLRTPGGALLRADYAPGTTLPEPGETVRVAAAALLPLREEG